MITKLSTHFALFSVLAYSCANSFAMVNIYPSEQYLDYFKLERIKRIISAQQDIMLSLFPEEASAILRCRAKNRECFFEDYRPLRSFYLFIENIYEDIYARQLYPLEEAWLLNHRKLHKLIVQTAVKAALEKFQPSENQIEQWVHEYIAFFFAPIASEPSETCPWSARDARHYSHMSDKCPDWLRSELEEVYIKEQAYPQIYRGIENARRQLELISTQDYINKIAYSILQKERYVSLSQVAINLVKSCIGESKISNKKQYSALLAQAIILGLGNLYGFNDIEPSNYEQAFIDSDLAAELTRTKESYLIKKPTKWAFRDEEKYSLNKAQLQKVISAWPQKKREMTKRT